ncbi:F-box/LRR-repeat protein 15 isoform X2 [Folsomia candida]|nr:F-box/LRR-repeat protein 15 isoform X2 [Folsomia candida]
MGRSCMDQYFSTLKEIEILGSFSAFAFQRVFRNCTKLKVLRLRKHCDWVDDASLSQLFTTNKELQEADLSGCSNLNGTCVHRLVFGCKGLKVLGLSGCNWVTPQSIELVMTHLTELERVDFSLCKSINNELLGHFIMRFGRLKRIKLAFMPAVNDATLLLISRSCPNLTHVDVSACGVTDHGIKSVAEYCKSLQSLKVRYCRGVTEASLRSLRIRGTVEIDQSATSNNNWGDRSSGLGIRVQV